jgi:hypothetical protein
LVLCDRGAVTRGGEDGADLEFALKVGIDLGGGPSASPALVVVVAAAASAEQEHRDKRDGGERAPAP